MSGNLCGYVVRAGTWLPVVGAVIEGSGQAPRVRSDRSWADGSWLAPQVSSLTDAAGRFMFDDLRQGEWLVRVEGAGGETLGKAVVHVLNNALSEVTIEVSGPFAPPPAYPHLPDAGRPAPMQPPSVMGSIRGRVVSAADARPVADATITVVFGAGPAPDIAPITNEDGWFAMDDLPCGRWRLRASGPGGEIGEAAVEVFDDALSEVTIETDGSPRRGWPDRRQPGAPDIAPDAVASGHGNVRGWVLRAGTGQPVAGCAIATTGGPAMTEQATLNSTAPASSISAGASWPETGSCGRGARTGLRAKRRFGCSPARRARSRSRSKVRPRLRGARPSGDRRRGRATSWAACAGGSCARATASPSARRRSWS